MFVGLEITSQSFLATPRRHYPAVAFACVPALAFLSVHFVKQIMGHPAIANAGVTIDSLGGELSHNLNTAILLSNGFIMVSLVWSTALSFAIDRRLKATAVVFAIGALMTLFGIIHSPRPDAGLFLPTTSQSIPEAWRLLDAAQAKYMLGLLAGYTFTAIAFWAWSLVTKPESTNATEQHLPEMTHATS